MSSRTLNRKQFLVFGASAAAASILAACGEDDPGTGGGSSGSGGSGTAGTSGSSAGGSVSGSAGSGTAGSASGSGGSAAGSGGSGGSSAGSGGSTAGSGGSAAGSGGASGSGGGGGSGGGVGGMCSSANIMQTSDEQHDHIPQDPTMLKMDLKAFINTATPTSMFTVPKEGLGEGHIHTFTLTAEQIATLKGGGMVTNIETSEDENHTHVYTLSCMA